MQNTSAKRTAGKTVSVPAVQNMQAYIVRHYRAAIIKTVNKSNAEGVLANLLNADLSGTWFTAKNCVIKDMEFFRYSRCLAVIDVTLMLTARNGNTYLLMQEIFADAAHGLDIITGDFYPMENRPIRNLIRLNSYLVPYLKKSELEGEMDALLEKHGLYTLDGAERSKAAALAEAMGLSISYLPLYDKPKTDSVLYFFDSDVDIAKDGEQKQTVRVKAGTIVINACTIDSESKQMPIFHECVHYELHYMFCRLQQMYNSDIRQLEKRRMRVNRHTNFKNPLPWIEWQAHRGAYALCMPEKLFLAELNARIDALECNDYYARILENAQTALANDFDFLKYRVRARAIQLGIIEAAGTLNYIDGHYIAPYEFSRENYQNGAIYHISPETLLAIYENDADLRARIDSGNFVYADGHLAVDDPRFVCRGKNGAVLTQYALENADMCCLRFSNTYDNDGDLDLGEYYYGALYSDEMYNKACFACIDNNGLDETERFRQLDEMIMEMPQTFSGALNYLMEKRSITESELSLASGLSVNTISRRRNDSPGKVYNPEQIVQLCLAMHLEPVLSDYLLELANVKLNIKNKQHRILSIILHLMYTKPMEEIQKTILQMGGKPFKDIYKAAE